MSTEIIIIYFISLLHFKEDATAVKQDDNYDWRVKLETYRQ